MVTSLHELTKQLDALTYNSRSVLNALIRSVLSAGSSDGYTVTRAGQEVRLSKLDIYHLYNLYQEWEVKINSTSSKVDEDGVNSYGLPELVASMDAEYQTENGDTSKTPYRDAVVKHAKILYMNSDNMYNTDDDWIVLVDRSSNPKMVINSAPIPVNIRTPIYDENLSTKYFSEYETYLFPRGYYTLDAMGAYGDGLTHNAGGHKWLFDIDSVFQVKSPLTVLGVQDNTWINRLPESYGDDKSYTLVVGENCFAYAPNNLISGRWNQSIASECAILGGVSNHAYASYAGIIGGDSCNVVGDNSAAGGMMTNTSGSFAFAYGYRTSVGGYAYPCYMGVNINDGNVIEPTTECQDFIEIDGCTYQRATISSTSNVSNDGTSRDLGPNEIYIKQVDIDYSGIRLNMISSGDNQQQVILDFKVGDLVCLYRMISNVGSANEFPISKVINAKVTGIVAHTNASRSQVYGYIVTLDQPVRTSHGLSATNGYVIRNRSINYMDIGADGMPTRRDGVNLSGNYSASFGIRTIAGGRSQFVAGAQNKELLRPNFIVGIGNSEYIDDAERYNGLVVAPYYNYSTVRRQYIAAGMSMFTTAESKFHGMIDDTDIANVRRYDEDDVDKYHGYYAYSDNSTRTRRALLRVYTGYSGLLVGDAGIDIFIPSESGIAESGLYKGVISTRISGGNMGSVLVSDIAGDDLSRMVDVIKSNFLMSNTSINSVIVGAQYQAVLSSSLLTVVHGNYTQLGGTHLQLAFTNDTNPDHSTYGALVAYPAALGAKDTGVNYYDRSIRKLMAYYGNALGTGWSTTREVSSGFYYATGTECIPSLMTGYANLAQSYHALNSSRVIYINDGTRPTQYSVAQILLPGYVTTGAAQHGHGSQLAHPVFVSTLVDTDNPDTYSSNVVSMASGKNYICEELAYMSDLADIESSISHLSNKTIYDMVRPAAATLTTAASTYIDTVYLSGKSYVANSGYFKSCMVYGQPTTDGAFIYPSSTRAENAFIDSLVNVDLYYDEKFLTLNSVALNPASIMRFGDVGQELCFAPVAYSPMQMAVTTEAERIIAVDTERTKMTYLTPYYGSYARETAPGVALSAGLSSTPFGSMVSYSNQEMNNKAAAVWVAMYNYHTERMEWVRIIENLIVVLHNGHLTVAFDCYPRADEGDYRMPAYPNMSATTLSDFKKYINSSSTMDYGTMTFNIPLSPELAGKIDHLVNPATGVAVQLVGQAYYTGPSNSFVSASIVSGFGVGWTGISTRFKYPSIQVSIAGFDLSPGVKYHYEVQGDVNYVE